MNTIQVFYMPARQTLVPNVIDEALPDAQGTLRGRYSGRTMVELSQSYPSLQLGGLADVIAQQEAMLTTQPRQTSFEDFEQALGMLPPQDYVGDAAGSSFKCQEHLSGRITAVHAMVDGKFYTFNDVCSITHAQIVEKIRSHCASAQSH